MTALRVLHLYPRELGINGDSGNVLALSRRARWQGIEVEVLRHSVGGELPDAVDLVHVGSGPLSSQRAVHADVLRIAGRLREWRDAGVPMLAISGGWQLLGEQFVTPEGETLEGAAVFPSRAVLGSERHVGEVVIRGGDKLPNDAALAGFENHSATTTLTGGAPLGTTVRGHGNGDGTEGVVIRRSVGTSLHGPVLPMNPALADRMLAAALGIPVVASPESEQADGYASRARRAIADRLGVSLQT